MSDCDTDDARAAHFRLEEAVSRLTEKERECLSRWLQHATAKEIALDLGITHHAVEKRLKSARQRLGVSTSLEAARLVEQIEGYDRAVSGSPELSPGGEPSDTLGHAATRPETPGLSRRRAMVSGVILMSLLLTILAFSMVEEPTLPATTHPKENASNVTDSAKKERMTRLFESAYSQLFESASSQTSFAARTFATLDLDSSGFIEKPELDGVKFNVRISDSSSTADETVSSPLVADADTDRDGRISASEYRDWLESLTRFEH